MLAALRASGRVKYAILRCLYSALHYPLSIQVAEPYRPAHHSPAGTVPLPKKVPLQGAQLKY